MIPVVADADTLFGTTTRGLWSPRDSRGLMRSPWSPLILSEPNRALVATGRKPHAGSACRHEQPLHAALPQAEIPTPQVQSRFAGVDQAIRCANDTHVVAGAAAILAIDFYASTQIAGLVTEPIRDFGVPKLGTRTRPPAAAISTSSALHAGWQRGAVRCLHKTCPALNPIHPPAGMQPQARAHPPRSPELQAKR